MRLKFADLSDTERAIVCNGCGGKGWIFDPPEFLFGASCDHHDFHYWRGGTEADRKTADRQFLAEMLDDAELLPLLKRPWHSFTAWVYYFAVRTFGRKCFHYGEPRGRRALFTAVHMARMETGRGGKL